MKTGYFGRARELVAGRWRKGAVSGTHLVGEDDIPLCRYRPHPTMSFQCCANGVHEPYVKCSGCRKALAKIQEATKCR